jgi:hypothetical protein
VRTRFVKVVRVSLRDWPHLAGKSTFFLPVYLEDPYVAEDAAGVHVQGGRLWSLVAPEDLPTVWGYETLAEAQAVLDRLDDEDAQAEADSLCRNDRGRGGREDFHSDG